MRILPLVLLASAPFVLSAASPNLLENSGFEFPSVRGKTPNGWSGSPPKGGTFEVDTNVFRSGGESLRFEVPDRVPVTWFAMYRGVEPLKRGATYTMSGWIRTENVRDGGGAYLSLNFFNGGGKRLTHFDSPVKVTGTKDWTHVTATGTIPDGSSEMRAILTLHGHGVVWFDDLQVEEGDTATEYQPASADAARGAKEKADRETAAKWLAALPERPSGHGRIAVLDMGVSPADFTGSAPGEPPRACPSSPGTLASALGAAGHVVVTITPTRLANPLAIIGTSESWCRLVATADASSVLPCW